ncbi:MAG: carbohydrate kinase [Gammaproteobacteria bacterium]|nr:carbohydrate kinase [Gammaproteobacteria bacterium]
MQKNRILLIGNCVLDQVWHLAQFPAQDEEMRARNQFRVMGGNACNSAQMLALLGNDVELVSSFAQDASAQWLLQQLTQAGIETRHCTPLAGFKTPESSIWLNAVNGSRTIVHFRDLPELELQQLQQLPLESCDWLHLEGRNVATLKLFLESLDVRSGISLEIEKDRPGIEHLLPFVNLVIVSSAYLQSRHLSADQCLQHFRQINPALNVVCTLGEQGLIAMDAAGHRIQQRAVPVQRVVDTIAAGDCFIAALIHQLLQQADFLAALDFAATIVAQKIQYQGITLSD